MALDPWDWGVDDVVRQLCYPEGELRTSDTQARFDFVGLENTLRDNDIDGETLLVALSRETLRSDLDIRSFGLRFRIWKIIEAARAQSTKFDNYRSEHPEKITESFLVSHAPLLAQDVSSTPQQNTLIDDAKSVAITHNTLSETAQPIEDTLTSASNAVFKRKAPVSKSLAEVRIRPGESLAVDASGKKRRRLVLSPTKGIFLSEHSLPVNTVLYGATHVDAAIEYGVVGRDGEMQREATADWSRTGLDGTLTHIQQQLHSKPGMSIYVHTILKQFLVFNDPHQPRYFRHGDLFSVGIQSIHSKKRRSRLAADSVTILRASHDGLVAERKLQGQWHLDESRTKESHRAWIASHPSRFDDAAYSNNWAFLDKYLEPTSSIEDNVVPAYGDSGTEGEYDTETWDEIQEERIEHQFATRQSIKGLSQSDVREIVAAAKADTKTTWETKRRPGLESKAWDIWTKAHKRGTSDPEISRLHGEYAFLSSRLCKLEENIYALPWARASELKLQCKSLEPTIQDIATVQWKLDLLQKPQAPVRSLKETPVKRRERQPHRPADLGDDEEELTDSDLDGFIVEDDLSAQTTPKDRVLPSGIDMDVEVQATHGSTSAIDGWEEDMDTTIEKLGSAVDASDNRGENSAPTDSSSAVLPSMRASTQSNDASSLPDVITISSPSDLSVDLFANLDFKYVRSMSWPQVDWGNQPVLRLAWLMVQHPDTTNEAVYALQSDSVEFNKVMKKAIRMAFKSMLLRDYTLRNHPDAFLFSTDLCFQMALWYMALFKKEPWGVDMNGADMRGLPEHLVKEAFSKFQEEDSLRWRTMQDCIYNSMEFAAFNGKGSAAIDPTGDSSNVAHDARSARSHFGNFKKNKNRAASGSKQQVLSKADQKRGMERMQQAEQRRKELHKSLELSASTTSTMDPVVNLNREASAADIRINPHIASRMKPHQLAGVQFLWTEVVTGNQGGLVAQPMGMGKTMQVIAFLLTLAEAARNPDPSVHLQLPKNLRRVVALILAPASLIENWHDELLKWLPSNSEETVGPIFKITSELRVSNDRRLIMRRWAEEGGVLLCSSSLFRSIQVAGAISDTNKLMSQVATIAVIDEAQEMKNPSSKLGMAVSSIKTRSRIAMTGSPLANNLMEYFSLVDWVSPGYLGNRAEFSILYEKPITKGQYADAAAPAKRTALIKQRALTQVLAPKVHRANYDILHRELHGKTEFTIRVPLTGLQVECYKYFVDSVQQQETGKDIHLSRVWAFISLLRLLCNHPKVFHDHLVQASNANGTAEDEHGGSEPPETPPSTGSQGLIDEKTAKEAEKLVQERPSELLGGGISQGCIQTLQQSALLESVHNSNKVAILVQIALKCRERKEKVLVFSQSIPTLDFIDSCLRTLRFKISRIDGRSSAALRQGQTKDFNEGQNEVCIVSTRAGGVGLNLYAASRVVVMDEGWNPMHEQQAIGRAYRFGQKQRVYVYRLMTAGTYEEEIRNQAFFKTGLANRVVDNKDTVRLAKKLNRSWLRPPFEEPQEDLSCVQGRDPAVLEEIVADEDMNGCFQSIKLGETFDVEEDEELTKEEQDEATLIISEDHIRRTDLQQYLQIVWARGRSLDQRDHVTYAQLELVWLQGLEARSQWRNQKFQHIQEQKESGALTPQQAEEEFTKWRYVMGPQHYKMPPPATTDPESSIIGYIPPSETNPMPPGVLQQSSLEVDEQDTLTAEQSASIVRPGASRKNVQPVQPSEQHPRTPEPSQPTVIDLTSSGAEARERTSRPAAQAQPTPLPSAPGVLRSRHSRAADTAPFNPKDRMQIDSPDLGTIRHAERGTRQLRKVPNASAQRVGFYGTDEAATKTLEGAEEHVSPTDAKPSTSAKNTVSSSVRNECRNDMQMRISAGYPTEKNSPRFKKIQIEEEHRNAATKLEGEAFEKSGGDESEYRKLLTTGLADLLLKFRTLAGPAAASQSIQKRRTESLEQPVSPPRKQARLFSPLREAAQTPLTPMERRRPKSNPASGLGSTSNLRTHLGGIQSERGVDRPRTSAFPRSTGSRPHPSSRGSHRSTRNDISSPANNPPRLAAHHGAAATAQDDGSPLQFHNSPGTDLDLASPHRPLHGPNTHPQQAGRSSTSNRRLLSSPNNESRIQAIPSGRYPSHRDHSARASGSQHERDRCRRHEQDRRQHHERDRRHHYSPGGQQRPAHSRGSSGRDSRGHNSGHQGSWGSRS